MKENLKIVALMPMYKFMETPCVQSLIMMMCDIYQHHDRFQIVFTQGINVALARNQLFKFAAELPEKDVDYILTLDSDHIYTAQALYTLITKMEENGISVLSASYPQRGGTVQSMIEKGDDNKLHNVARIDDKIGIQECEAIGFGFAVFKPELIRLLSTKHNGILFVMDGKSYTGEDVYFCNLVKAEGYKVYYDADTTIGHLTTIISK